jgi:hypothetical protein
MDCNGLPWIAMDCHGLPWIAMDGLPMRDAIKDALKEGHQRFHGWSPLE